MKSKIVYIVSIRPVLTLTSLVCVVDILKQDELFPKLSLTREKMQPLSCWESSFIFHLNIMVFGLLAACVSGGKKSMFLWLNLYFVWDLANFSRALICERRINLTIVYITPRCNTIVSLGQTSSSSGSPFMTKKFQGISVSNSFFGSHL